ncbi:MAG: hypothetical protein WCX81_06745 [Monoglobales bacterium]
MNYKDFYTQIYKLTENVTPLPVDCGKLCDGCCCKGDEDTGMYLFPGEKVMYEDNPSWAKIRKSGFTFGSYRIDFLSCTGSCDRSLRPLACRIFPLFPYIDISGELHVMMDPRGKGICPLIRAMNMSDLDKRFCDMVTYVLKLMLKNPLLYSYLFELSRFTEQYCLDLNIFTTEK